MSPTQKERREATVARLLDAGISVIAESGYSRASAQVIADRAGVSTGALFRHFTSMTEFITATAREVMYRQTTAANDRLAQAPDADIATVLQIVRENCATTTNTVMQELIVAARTDPALQASMQSALVEFGLPLFETARLALGDALDDHELATWLFVITDMFDYEAFVRTVRPYPELVQLRIPLFARLLEKTLIRANSTPHHAVARTSDMTTRRGAEATPRGRLYLAALDAVADQGYADTTVTDIVSRAGISRRTFYELHQDKAECLAAAFRFAVEFVETKLDAATADRSGDWRARLYASLDAYLRILAEEGACARALHVECLAAGREVVTLRSETKAVYARRIRTVFGLGREAGDLRSDVPDQLFDAIVAAIDDRIRDCLNGPGAEGLPLLASDLYELTVAVFGAERVGPPVRE